MESGRGIVEIFGKCSRLLNKTALNIEDDFFSRLCAKKSDKLLSEFIFFLRREGDGHEHYIAQSGALRQQVVAKPGNIAQRKCNVAQCCQPLISQIKNILNLLDILKHLGLAKLSASLLLEKNLLLLKLSVLNICQSTTRLVTEAEKPAPLKIKKTGLRRLHKINPPKLGQTHQEISEFIKSKERTQNLEVFSQFNYVGRRTLKRKLSELIKAGAIKRLTDGKKVFYTAP
jgi:hypothetical protein